MAPPPLPFNEQHRTLTELLREASWLNAHNRRFRTGDPQTNLLLFAEAAVILLAIEHFLRVILAAGPDENLGNMLERATAREIPGRRPPPRLALPQQRVEGVFRIRNAVLHGNFSQLAQEAGFDSVERYFGERFVVEVQALYETLDVMLAQTDPATGQPQH